ncbi:MAG: flagellar motor protein MotB [Hyphomicrobiales bacterium]
MAEQEVHELVIIKHRRDHDEEAHHGGVWKIAYADFMTAMMAFFLVLWLLNSTNKEARISILNYFNPIKLADASMTRKGIIDQKNAQPASTPDAGKKTESGQPGEKRGDDGLSAPSNAPDEAGKRPPAETKQSEGGKPQAAAKPRAGEKTQEGAKPQDGRAAANQKTPYSEAALFADPYRILSEIAAQAPTEPPPAAAKAAGEQATAGDQGGSSAAAYRDPFESVSPRPTLQPSVAVSATAPAIAPDPAPQTVLQPAQAPVPASVPAKLAPGKTTSQDDAANASSPAAQADAAKLQADMSKALNDEIAGQPAPKIDVQATSEGVLISLTDEFDFGMFAIGSAEPQAKLVKIMEKIALLLKTRPGAIVVRGHTDGRAYKSLTYDNWRLSSDRAQMARFMLVRGGLDDKRFEAVEGYADRRLKTPGDPSAAENRRIEILLRKDKP